MESTKIRFKALDGLRGIAILLVFLNHISTNFILQAIPPFLRPLMETFTVSGRTAVSIFFLLSGFLMAYFYPVVENKTKFLQKRYTRIFPLFISFVITRSILRNFPEVHWALQLLAIFIPAIVIHLLWVYGVKKLDKPWLVKGLFFGFIGLQILTGIWYLVGILRQPAIVFNQQVSPIIREVSIGFVNATLTLPLGDYIPLLDGVYWSLVAEVLFYVVFPFTFAPIAQYMRSKSKTVVTIFLLALIPFFLGLDLLSKNIMLLSVLDLSFFYYFVLGITAAAIIRAQPDWLKKIEIVLSKPLMGLIMSVLLFGIFFLVHTISSNVSSEWRPLSRILFAFPLSFIFLTTVIKNSTFGTLLESKWLVFLGTVSYSMYLAHTSVVDVAKGIYTPVGLTDNVLFVIVVFGVLCAVSAAMFYLLEQPYFSSKKVEAHVKREDKELRADTKIKPVFAGIAAFYLALILFAFQSDFNFFSIEHRYSKDLLTSPVSNSDSSISLRQNPKLLYSFTAKDDNMGILTMDLEHSFIADKGHQNVRNIQQILEFRIKESGQKDWLAKTQYKPVEIGDSKNHPFGFPLQLDSKGKKYDVELELSYPDHPEYMSVNVDDSLFKSVHQLNKYEVVTSPPALFSLLSNRVVNVVTNRDAHTAFYSLLPFIAFVIFF